MLALASEPISCAGATAMATTDSDQIFLTFITLNPDNPVSTGLLIPGRCRETLVINADHTLKINDPEATGYGCRDA
jgi:hypothetical protein